jgi:NAD(P)-dependent dehydrogenase (short-subunit alcohol dehydrogenase family)
MTGTRVVIVTGGGGAGCGRAISRRFAKIGAAVVVADLDEAAGRSAVDLIQQGQGRAEFFHADVRIDSQAKALVSFAEETFGGVDTLVNNASAPVGDAIETWANVLETDLLGSIHTTRWAMESMKRAGGGVVVNIASISALWHGRKTPGGFPGYDVAKMGVIRMTTRLAHLAEKDGIRVNCLAPGWIATDGPREYWESLTPEQRVERGVPARLISTEEIADAVLALSRSQSLNGRVVIWWSDDLPRIIEWGDQGYRDAAEFVL